MTRLLFSICASLLIFFGCDGLAEKEDERPIIAEVNGRKLYADELQNLIHPSVNAYDSTGMANAYIDQWIKNQLMMSEASKFFTSDFEIERLVRDYREKLIVINLEEKVLEERYNTVIRSEDLLQFYDVNKEQFILDRPIFQIRSASLESDHPDYRMFRTAWRNNDVEGMLTLAESHSDILFQQDSVWHDSKEVLKFAPSLNPTDLRRLDNFELRDQNYQFFLKVLVRKDEGEISPLSYVEERLRRMMLHQRKQKIIEEYKQELYERALNNNVIKI